MHSLLIVTTLLIGTAAHAQIYQCTKGGKTAFQDSPCDAGSAAKVIANRASSGAFNWDELKPGMSVDEVKQKFPGLKPGNEGKLVTGARELLHGSQVSLGGVTFEAGFFFIGGKFTQVNLLTDAADKNETNLKVFEKLFNEFRAKYGPETKRVVKHDAYMLSADATWESEKGKVWVGVLPLTADTSNLLAGFVPR